MNVQAALRDVLAPMNRVGPNGGRWSAR